MLRGPLLQDSYSPHFSGHETFPLRYGWLKKVYDRVSELKDVPNNRAICWKDDAISAFGVGKNMVRSMRHWALASNVISERSSNTIETTKFGDLIFGEAGIDPYMEYPTSLWLTHWQLAKNLKKTTNYWVFNHHPSPVFTRENLLFGLSRLVQECGWASVSPNTLNKDIACFIRTYTSKPQTAKTSFDDTLESPLTELGLIKSSVNNESFRLTKGRKPTLSNQVFTLALIDYWVNQANLSNASTLSFESLVYGAGSPGKLFVLDENEVIEQLTEIEHTSNGRLRWSETTGLKQVVRSGNVDVDMAYKWIRKSPASILDEVA